MKIYKEFENTKGLVEKLMQDDIRCRNDDKWLCYCVLRQYTNAFIPFKDFNKFPAFETITRTRRIIQNDECRLLPIESVQRKRTERQNKILDWVKK